ncbi:MAG: CBS domain-containing protein, partial [Betaproteobacteria bacterium]
MSADPVAAVAALDRRYLLDYPREAARHLEKIAIDDAASLLSSLPPSVVLPVWQSMTADAAAGTLRTVAPPLARQWLSEAEPAHAASVLAQFDDDERARLLDTVDAEVAKELRDLLAYPEDAAGRLMDPNVAPLRADLSVEEALTRLKAIRRRGLRELFVVDDEGRLSGRVEIQDLATTDPALPLHDITRKLIAVVQDLDPREDIVTLLQQQPITELPVVNV